MADLEKMSLVELRVAGRKMGVKNVTTYKNRGRSSARRP